MNTYKQYRNPSTGDVLSIHYDEYPENPRTSWDNLGVVVVRDNCQYISNEGDFDLDFGSREGDERALVNSRDIVAYLPLYVFDHSGVSFNTTGFGCPWDSGQIGWIVCTREGLRQAGFDWKRITRKRREKIFEWLQGEVDTYSAYASGETYGFTVETAEGDQTDSCFGYYGDDGLQAIMEDNPGFTEEIA